MWQQFNIILQQFIIYIIFSWCMPPLWWFSLTEYEQSFDFIHGGQLIVVGEQSYGEVEHIQGGQVVVDGEQHEGQQHLFDDDYLDGGHHHGGQLFDVVEHIQGGQLVDVGWHHDDFDGDEHFEEQDLMHVIIDYGVQHI